MAVVYIGLSPSEFWGLALWEWQLIWQGYVEKNSKGKIRYLTDSENQRLHDMLDQAEETRGSIHG